MKKILTIIVSLVSFLSGFGQDEYAIEMSGIIGYGGHCRTVNRGIIEVGLNLQDGSYKSLFDAIDTGDGVSVDQPNTSKRFNWSSMFDMDNPAVSVRFVTEAKDNGNSGYCPGRRLVSTLSIPNPNCHDEDYEVSNGTDSQSTSTVYAFQHRFNEISSLNIKVYPNVELDFEDNISSNNIQTACSDSGVDVKAKSGFDASVYNWEFLDILNVGLDYDPAYRNLLNRLESQIEEFRQCNEDCEYDYEDSDDINDCQDDCDYISDNITAIRQLMERWNPDDILINTIKPIWRKIPVSKDGLSSVNLKLTDLYPDEIDQKNAIGKTIDIRVNTQCVIGQETIYTIDDETFVESSERVDRTQVSLNQLAIQFLPDPPNVIDIEYPERACVSQGVTDLTLFFGRQLLTDEILYVNLVKRQDDGSYIPYYNNGSGGNQEGENITLTKIADGRYSYILAFDDDDDLPDGDFRIDTFSYFGNSNLASCGKSVNLENDDSIYKFEILSPDPVEFTARIYRSACLNRDNGQIQITTVSGGSEGDYEYKLNDNDWRDLNSFPVLVNSVKRGDNTLVIKDGNGCESDPQYFKIEELDQIVLKGDVTHPDTSGGRGSITITNVINGEPLGHSNPNGDRFISYELYYEDSNGDDNIELEEYPDVLETSITIDDLRGRPEDYIFVYRSNGCSTSYRFNITDPEPLEVDLEIDNDITCYGEDDGRINAINQNGGYPPYSYTWSKDGIVIPGFQDVTSTSTIGGAGVYSVTIKDSRGVVMPSGNITLKDPDEIKINDIAVTPMLCFGGLSHVSVVANGPTGANLEYAVWAGTTTVWQDNPEFSLEPSQANYHFRVRDSNSGCLSEIVELQEKIIEPQQLFIDLGEDILLCEGQTVEIDATISGATSYQWTSTNGFSNTASKITIDTVGNYDVEIINSDGCLVTGSISVQAADEVNINSGSGETVFLCQGKTVELDVTINNPGATYQWTSTNGFVSQDSKVIVDAIGVYEVTVTNSNGCHGTTSISVEPATEVVIDLGEDIILCQGEFTELDATINDANATYQWTSTNGFYSQEPIITVSDTGTYEVIITNSNKCDATASIYVEASSNNAINNLAEKNFLCEGETVELDATINDANATYQWTSTNGFFSTASKITIDTVGDYDLEIINSNGCLLAKTVSVEAATEVTFNLGQTLFLCEGETVELDVTINDSDATYQWTSTNGFTSQEAIVFVSATGVYEVTVTNSNGCHDTKSITVKPATEVVINLAEEILLCEGEAVEIDATINDQFARYQWRSINGFSSEEPIINVDAIGVYEVTVINSNGCEATKSINVVPATEVIINLEKDITLCKGETIELDATINDANATYQWWSTNTGFSSQEPIITVSDTGTYNVIVTNSNGCEAIESISVDVSEVTINLAEEIIICEGQTVELDVTINDANATYQWSSINGFSSQDAVVTIDDIGVYEVTVTNSNGCHDTKSINVVLVTQVTIDLGEDITLCKDQYTEIDATLNDPDAIYQWTSTNGFTSNNPIIAVHETGIYEVTVTNGCYNAVASVYVEATDEIIDANFFSSTQVFAQEEFVIVDNSDPFPDRIEWVLPLEAEVLYKDQSYAELIIDTPGEYEITLITKKGLCEDFKTKTIIVLDKQFDTDDNQIGDTEYVKTSLEYKVYPTPVKGGHFTLDIELPKIYNVSIKMFGMSNNVQYDYRSGQGSAEYKFEYNLPNLTTGLYFLLIELSNGTSTIHKLIVE